MLVVRDVRVETDWITQSKSTMVESASFAVPHTASTSPGAGPMDIFAFHLKMV